MPNILFVCTANICRSPMAVGLFKAKLKAQGLEKDWVVHSAGTWGMGGVPAAEEAVEALAVRGVDIGDHRSRIVKGQIIRNSDLILTMEKGHKEALMVEFPEKEGQIFMLTELVGQPYDFPDPIGQPLEAFQEAARDLQHLLDGGFAEILKRARGENLSHL
jgi:protein-tyrosine-phosphatase